VVQNLSPVTEVLDLVTKAYVDGEITSHTHDTRYYTESEIDTFLSGKSDTGHTHDHGATTGLGDDDHTQYYNAARHTKAVHDALTLDHGSLSGRTDDDHPQYACWTNSAQNSSS